MAAECCEPGKLTKLVFISLLSTLGIVGVHADLLVVLLQGSHVLPGLGELSLLHTLSHVPMDKGPLGVHEVELVVQPSPGLRDGGGVGQHADGPLHLGEVTAGDDSRGLVVDSNLEPGRAPVNELDAPLGLDGRDGGVHVLGDHISSVQHAAGHVLSVPRITFYHGVGRLEAGVGDLSYAQLLVIGLLSRDNGGVGDQGEMDPGVGHQVGLELIQVYVEGTIEPQGSSDGRNNLTDQPVKVGVRWSLNIEVTTADVVDSLVVDHEGAVGVLEGGVGAQGGVVGLNNSSCNLSKNNINTYIF